MSSEKASLRDVLNYEPEQYLSEDEVALIRSTFKDNPRLLAVLRKVLLPTISDPTLPIEEMGHDAYLAGVDWAQIPSDQIKPIILGRSEAIKFVIGALIKLKVIANAQDESPYQKEMRRKLDSTK
jgi:hypothetical protein